MMIKTLDVRAGDRVILQLRDFAVEAGRINFLFGESGIGKSLSAKILYGLADSGNLEFRVNGMSYENFARESGTDAVIQNSFFVFQEPSSHFNPLFRIRQQMVEGVLAQADYDPVLASLWSERKLIDVDKLLTIFPRPYRPSGGEKQRLMLAMALARLDLWFSRGDVSRPHLFVFDEPTGNLDDAHRNNFLDELLARHRIKPFTSLVITHDYSMVSYLLAKYRDAETFCSFVEFRKEEDIVRSHRFDPKNFIRWVETLSPLSGTSSGVLMELGNPVQTAEHRLHIFRGDKESRLTIKKGSLVYLKGPSGAGKTTVAKILMGLRPATHLEMSFDGKNFTAKTPANVWRDRYWGRRMSMVFQHADEALNLNSRVRQIFEGLPRIKRAIFDEAVQVLFGGPMSPDFWERPVRFLSGGEKQRLNLIRSLALGTDLVILDEPFSGIDFSLMTRVLPFIEKRLKDGQSLIIISHQEEIFDRIVDKDSVYHVRINDLSTSGEKTKKGQVSGPAPG